MTHSPEGLDPSPPFEPSERQREILERAFDLIQEAGLANLTLKRVAERVGFTEAAIYRHFASKRELVLALVDRLGGRMLGRMHEIASAREVPARVRIERMVRHHVRLLLETRGLPLTLMAEGLASGDEELVGRFGGVIRRYRALLAEQLAQLGSGAPLPAELRSIHFLGLPAAIGLLIRAQPELTLSETEIDRLVHVYVDALTAPGRAGEEKQP